MLFPPAANQDLCQRLSHFQFPAYLGHNWDALADCLVSLDSTAEGGRNPVFPDCYLTCALGRRKPSTGLGCLTWVWSKLDTGAG
jgi:hypothetical protein